MGTAVRQR